MYNREEFISRSINSCLEQNFNDFEIVVVDDGSSDRSVDVVRKYNDHRLKLIYHGVNRGVGPARNTGLSIANGNWIICLDSDDELLPGSLSVIYKRSLEVDENIFRLLFMVKLDTGELSPEPPLKEETWDYIKYIKWMENSSCQRSETLPVVRRVTFDKVKYYNDRTLEGPYHMDFMKNFNAKSFPDVVRLYYHDAENQLTKPNIYRTIESARNQAAGESLLLKNHGSALKIYAPRIFCKKLSSLATLHFLSGNRLKGIEYSFYSFSYNFFSIRNWAILLFGLLGAKPLAWLKCYSASYSKP